MKENCQTWNSLPAIYAQL